MEREIKFRGQRIDNKQWIYGYYVISRARHEGWEESGCWFSIHVETSDFEDPGHYNVHPETVGQFTGLKDKNGKEIYEGDIIVEEGIDDNIKGTIIFQAGAFVIDWEMEDTLVDILGWDKQNHARNVEIIGNIYENPELVNTLQTS